MWNVLGLLLFTVDIKFCSRFVIVYGKYDVRFGMQRNDWYCGWKPLWFKRMKTVSREVLWPVLHRVRKIDFVGLGDTFLKKDGKGFVCVVGRWK
jgi:hypothetical protein